MLVHPFPPIPRASLKDGQPTEEDSRAGRGIGIGIGIGIGMSYAKCHRMLAHQSQPQSPPPTLPGYLGMRVPNAVGIGTQGGNLGPSLGAVGDARLRQPFALGFTRRRAQPAASDTSLGVSFAAIQTCVGRCPALLLPLTLTLTLTRTLTLIFSIPFHCRGPSLARSVAPCPLNTPFGPSGPTVCTELPSNCFSTHPLMLVPTEAGRVRPTPASPPALCSNPSALPSIPSTLCSTPSTLCSTPSTLCCSPGTLCGTQVPCLVPLGGCGPLFWIQSRPYPCPPPGRVYSRPKP